MVKILMAGLGGFAGSICRYLVYQAVLVSFKEPWLPLGTLTVNVAGCLIIGFLGGLAEYKDIFSPEIRALLFVGFLGGFTTFSSFGLEVFTMLSSGRTQSALATISLHLVLGISAVWVGFVLARVYNGA